MIKLNWIYALVAVLLGAILIVNFVNYDRLEKLEQGAVVTIDAQKAQIDKQRAQIEEQKKLLAILEQQCEKAPPK